MSNQELLQRELNLPVSVNKDGESVTLSEFVDEKDPLSLSLSELNVNQWSKVVVERFRQQEDIRLAAIGGGEIDQKRAIAEVEALSPLGQALIESEQYVIETIVYESKYGRLKDLLKKEYV